jgi:hypothetical protein
MTKLLKARRSNVDEKDVDCAETLPEPKTHHFIICKICNLEKNVSLKYTRNCDKCRTGRGSRGSRRIEPISWDIWGHGSPFSWEK